MSKKTALITGAGSGIGRATAQKLANHGINLILIGRNLNKLEEKIIELDSLNNKLILNVFQLILVTKKK